MKMGLGVTDAVREVVNDLLDLKDPYVAHINIIALDRQGNHAGCSFRPEKKYAALHGGCENANATLFEHENPHPWHIGETGWLACKRSKPLCMLTTHRQQFTPCKMCR